MGMNFPRTPQTARAVTVATTRRTSPSMIRERQLTATPRRFARRLLQPLNARPHV